MPVRREGRYVTTSPVELSEWLGRESHAPEAVRIASDAADLTADLKRGITAARRKKRRAA